MRRIWTSLVLALTCVMGVGACVDGRLRPPTAVEADGGRRDPSGPPLVYITAPRDGQDLPTPLWLNGSGVQVTYGGEYRDGDALRVMAFLDYPDYSETLPFFVNAFTIVGQPEGSMFIRGQSDQFRDALRVTILLEIHDPEGYLISVDSVTAHLR
jgi:hypothetical protein